MLRANETIRVIYMSTGTHPPELLKPTFPEDREQVLKELDAILASYHFRGSKRYPALLKYVVDAALDGRSSDLKERTLGVEVFGREPNYDTNADPVVRFSASEVRKRIAQYYHENVSNSRLQIDLPLGSYVPEFIPRSLSSGRSAFPTTAVLMPEKEKSQLPQSKGLVNIIFSGSPFLASLSIALAALARRWATET